MQRKFFAPIVVATILLLAAPALAILPYLPIELEKMYGPRREITNDGNRINHTYLHRKGKFILSLTKERIAEMVVAQVQSGLKMQDTPHYSQLHKGSAVIIGGKNLPSDSLKIVKVWFMEDEVFVEYYYELKSGKMFAIVLYR